MDYYYYSNKNKRQKDCVCILLQEIIYKHDCMVRETMFNDHICMVPVWYTDTNPVIKYGFAAPTNINFITRKYEPHPSHCLHTVINVAASLSWPEYLSGCVSQKQKTFLLLVGSYIHNYVIIICLIAASFQFSQVFFYLHSTIIIIDCSHYFNVLEYLLCPYL